VLAVGLFLSLFVLSLATVIMLAQSLGRGAQAKPRLRQITLSWGAPGEYTLNKEQVFCYVAVNKTGVREVCAYAERLRVFVYGDDWGYVGAGGCYQVERQDLNGSALCVQTYKEQVRVSVSGTGGFWAYGGENNYQAAGFVVTTALPDEVIMKVCHQGHWVLVRVQDAGTLYRALCGLWGWQGESIWPLIEGGCGTGTFAYSQAHGAWTSIHYGCNEGEACGLTNRTVSLVV